MANGQPAGWSKLFLMLTAGSWPSLRRAWGAVRVESRAPEIDEKALRRWLADLPPALGYRVVAQPLRYRRAPHLAGFTSFDDRLIALQVPKPFEPFAELVYYGARRKAGTKMRFSWFSHRITFRSRREVVRFLYCHEFYHWYLHQVLGRKAAAETACDRFALKHFRARHRTTDWAVELKGYELSSGRLLRRSA